jgi:hypothetical protein
MDNEKLRKIRGGNVIPSVIFQRNPAVNAPRIA